MRYRWLIVCAIAAVAGGALAQDTRVADARRTLAQLNLDEAELTRSIGANRGELARLLGALAREEQRDHAAAPPSGGS